MKIHRAVREDLHLCIEQNAKKIGLDIIDFGNTYSLVKLGAKHQNINGYPDKFLVARNAKISLVGDLKEVWLAAETVSRWYKTSPIQSVKKISDDYEFETENSIYRLESRS